MTDTARDDVAATTLSDHSRLLIARHRAMRADSRRLITATNGLPVARRATLGSRPSQIVTLIHDHRSEDDVLHPFHHPVAHLPTRRRATGA